MLPKGLVQEHREPHEPCSAFRDSSFEKLPTEIRLQIYSFLVEKEPGTIHIWRGKRGLYNSLCRKHSNPHNSFGPLGTIHNIIGNGNFNQNDVVKEGMYKHHICYPSKRHPSRPRISLSLFRTCRQLYKEALPLIDRMYSTAIFHFNDIPELEGFVDTLGPYRRSLLRYIHLTLSVASVYDGIDHALSHTLNRLQPNPYHTDCSNLVPYAHFAGGIRTSGKLRLRIRFRQYTMDHPFNYAFAPAITTLLQQLPSYLCRTITVMIPPLRPEWVYAPATLPGAPRVLQLGLDPKWHTRIVPSNDVRCLAAMVIYMMSARKLMQEKKRWGNVRVNQWICGCHGDQRDNAWWMTEPWKDMDVKFTVLFAA